VIRDQEAIRCLFIPTRLGELLVPGAAIAEIVRTAPLAPAGPDTPPWLIGALDWRGERIPVARLADSTNSTATRHHIVICFMPGADPRLPYAGIEFAGLPQLEPITAKTLDPEIEDRDTAPRFAAVPFKHNGKPAWFLDMDALEHALLG